MPLIAILSCLSPRICEYLHSRASIAAVSLLTVMLPGLLSVPLRHCHFAIWPRVEWYRVEGKSGWVGICVQEESGMVTYMCVGAGTAVLQCDILGCFSWYWGVCVKYFLIACRVDGGYLEG